MILKIKTSATEPMTNLLRGINTAILPDRFIEEINRFGQVNKVHIPNLDSNIPCPMCLKAHIVKTCEEMGINPLAAAPILKKLRCKVGHNGYYLNGNKLIAL